MAKLFESSNELPPQLRYLQGADVVVDKKRYVVKGRAARNGYLLLEGVSTKPGNPDHRRVKSINEVETLMTEARAQKYKTLSDIEFRRRFEYFQ